MSRIFIKGTEINGLKVISGQNNITLASQTYNGPIFFHSCSFTDAPKDLSGNPSFLLINYRAAPSFAYQLLFHDNGNIYYRFSWNSFQDTSD